MIGLLCTDLCDKFHFHMVWLITFCMTRSGPGYDEV